MLEETWATETESFKTIDTKFTKHTFEGLLLWLDASDVDGDGQRDNIADGSKIPLWIDKSRSSKDAKQSLLNKMPSYSKDGLANKGSIVFKSNHSLEVGTLNEYSGPISVFAIAEGDGVIIGADNGIYHGISMPN